MARGDLTYDQLVATTQEYIVPTITPQIYDDNILLDRIRKGKHVKICTGGRKVFHPIRDIELAEAVFTNPNAARVANHKDTRTALELNWTYLVCDAVMMWDEKIANRGKPQIISLVKDKMVEAMEDVHKKFSTVMYQAYASKASTELDGVYAICQTANDTTTYAGISAANSTDWDCGLYDTTTTTLALYGSDSMDSAIRAVWFRGRPDLIVTTRAIAAQYASKLQPGERRKPMDGKSGATDLSFQGIPIITDPQCPAGDMIFMNTNHLWLYTQAGQNFNAGKWEQDPTGYFRDRSLISFVGNLVCDKRRSMGAFTALNYS
jgi:hypothetical protein